MAWQKITDEYGGTYYVDETTGAYSATKPAGFQDQSVYWTDPGPAPQPGWSYDNAAGQYIQPQDVAAYKQANPNANITEVQAQMQDDGGFGEMLGLLAMAAPFAFATGGAGFGSLAGELGGASTGALDLAALGPVSYGAPAAAGGLGGLGSIAGDIGSAAFPLDAATVGGMNGSAVLGGAAGTGLPNFPTGTGLSDSILAEAAPGAGGTLASGVGGSGGGSATQSVLQRLLGLQPGTTSGDLVDILGKVAPGLISAYGRSEQSDALQAIADQSRADRAPFLAKANEWMSNPQAYAEGPGASVLNGVLRKLSATHGNPIDSPTALGIATEAGLSDWRNAYTGAANLGLAGEDTRATLQTNAVNAGNIWPSLGDAAASVFGDGQDDINKLLSRLNGSGLNASFTLR